ncbi:MAG: recombinase family protein [Gemmatimonadaceae bacterium]|nr:recombinase family protein [Gemmatimonadaceae bacterium]
MDLTGERSQKITPRHLRRHAYLYVRQSTLRQVVENTESTQRQYALKQRAVALGWPIEQVVVIDCDLGQSGASAVDRAGFQQLVRDVGLGRAGLVMGLEVSRLARNSTDWHRLLEICALTETLILDEDGLYDPAHFNDRLLLGLKGTMSEAELHVLRARLRGGIVNKARRGELETPLPIGLVYDAAGRVTLDPDQQVQDTIRALFQTFRRTGSAMATVKAFRHEQLLMPRRARHGAHAGETLWGPLEHSRALWILHNPRYAGAFFFGRSRQRHTAESRVISERLPREEWTALIPQAHAGYITWEDFEENQRRLRENAQVNGSDRRRSPPREGPALLQGLAVCGRCGDRMTVRYHACRGTLWPTYVCQHRGIAQAQPICQSLPGHGLDEAIGRLLIETVTPLTLEVTLTVQHEIQARLEESDRLHERAVDRARYEADLARRRYLQVDPANRLVADELEAQWNRALQQVTDAHTTAERHRHATRVAVDAEARARILALATDFPRLWQDPQTPDRERKRMVRLLLDDITLIKAPTGVTAHVRFRGGATTTLTVPRSLTAWQLRETSAEIVARIDQLLETDTDVDIAATLNEQGYLSGTRQPFHRLIVRDIRRSHGLRSRYDRLRAQGMLTQREIADRLHVSTSTVKIWGSHGLLRRTAYNDKHEWLYEPPGPTPPVTRQGRRLSDPRRRREFAPDRGDEVQYET